MSGNHTKKLHIRWKTLRRAVLFAVSVLLLLAAVIWKGALAGSLGTQTVAGKWQAGELRYTQVSCFIDEDAAVSSQIIEMLRKNVDNTLETEALSPETDSSRLWLDAYSGEMTMTASRGVKSTSARAICVGGDFFYFHELDMMDGWYFSENDVMQDTVVIDRELAWQLFGAFDLEGMSLEINGYPCVVAGVYRAPTEGAEAETYGSEPTVYLSYALLEKLGLIVPVTCYEAVLPDPVSNFGVNIINNALALDESSVNTVENTYRYSLKNSVKSVADFAYASTRTDGIDYPYWENAAIYVSNWCRLLTLLAMLFAIYPVIILCILIVKAITMRKLLFKKLANLIKKTAMKINSRRARKLQINTEDQ